MWDLGSSSGNDGLDRGRLGARLFGIGKGCRSYYGGLAMEHSHKQAGGTALVWHIIGATGTS